MSIVHSLIFKHTWRSDKSIIHLVVCFHLTFTWICAACGNREICMRHYLNVFWEERSSEDRAQKLLEKHEEWCRMFQRYRKLCVFWVSSYNISTVVSITSWKISHVKHVCSAWSNRELVKDLDSYSKEFRWWKLCLKYFLFYFQLP